MTFRPVSGDVEMAAKGYGRVLALTHEYDSIIFLMFRRMGLRAADVTARVLPRDSQTGGNYLESVIRGGGLTEAETVWAWLSNQGLDKIPLASRYMEFLMQNGKGAAAAALWAAYVGPRRGDFPSPNSVYNGRFANEPSGSWILKKPSPRMTWTNRSR